MAQHPLVITQFLRKDCWRRWTWRRGSRRQNSASLSSCCWVWNGKQLNHIFSLVFSNFRSFHRRSVKSNSCIKAVYPLYTVYRRSIMLVPPLALRLASICQQTLSCYWKPILGTFWSWRSLKSDNLYHSVFRLLGAIRLNRYQPSTKAA